MSRDIHCRFCGEPWDQDELHEMAGHRDAGMGPEPKPIPYEQAAKQFKERGCAAFQDGSRRRCTAPVVSEEFAEAAAITQEMFEYPEEWS